MKKVTNHQNIRIIKINNCKSLSGKSNLEYQIGCLDDSGIFVRAVKNSGGGWFSNEWLALNKLIEVLQATKQPLTSYALQTFFKGKSINTAAFVFAALKEEGLVANDPDNPRCYLLQSVDNFMQPIKALISSGVALQDTSLKTSKASAVKIDDIIPVLSSSAKLTSGKTKAQLHKA
ncbi:MAG: hypothetical protein WBL28_03380 [Methylotenera sp.]